MTNSRKSTGQTTLILKLDSPIGLVGWLVYDRYPTKRQAVAAAAKYAARCPGVAEPYFIEEDREDLPLGEAVTDKAEVDRIALERPSVRRPDPRTATFS